MKKTCNRCNEEKPLIEGFYIDRKSPDGRGRTCRKCDNARRAKSIKEERKNTAPKRAKPTSAKKKAAPERAKEPRRKCKACSKQKLLTTFTRSEEYCNQCVIKSEEAERIASARAFKTNTDLEDHLKIIRKDGVRSARALTHTAFNTGKVSHTQFVARVNGRRIQYMAESANDSMVGLFYESTKQFIEKYLL